MDSFTLRELILYWEDLYAGKPLDTFLKEVKKSFDDEEIKENSIKQLHRFFQLDELRKKGVIDKSDYIQNVTEISEAAYGILKTISSDYLPILPIMAVAGKSSGPYYSIEYHQIEEWKHMPKGKIKNRIGIRVEGDSMKPHYIDGDVLICRKTTLENVSERQPVVVVGTDNSLFLKNIRKNGSALELMSLNEEFETFELPLREVSELWLVETKTK
jgi:SOS-response transcriptional repressor LexA